MASAMGKIVWYIKALKGRHVFQEIHEEICAMVTFVGGQQVENIFANENHLCQDE